MSIKKSAGLQDSGTDDEPRSETTDIDRELAELIEQHENINWSDVPGVSAPEAGAWTVRLIEAREALTEGQ